MISSFSRIIIVVVLVFTACSPAKKATKADVQTLENLKLHIQYLADDKLEGRRTGTNGEKMAMEYISNQFANSYQQLSYINHNVSGYISQMGFDPSNPEFQLPTSITGGAYNKYYADYYHQSTGQKIASLGRNWAGGLYAGLSYWSLDAASGHSYVNLGGRLVKKALE